MTQKEILDKQRNESIATLNYYGPLVEKFLESDLGKYYLESIDAIIDQQISSGDTAETNQLRHYDRANGAKLVKEMMLFPKEAIQEGGLVDQLMASGKTDS